MTKAVTVPPIIVTPAGYKSGSPVRDTAPIITTPVKIRGKEAKVKPIVFPNFGFVIMLMSASKISLFSIQMVESFNIESVPLYLLESTFTTTSCPSLTTNCFPFWIVQNVLVSPIIFPQGHHNLVDLHLRRLLPHLKQRNLCRSFFCLAYSFLFPSNPLPQDKLINIRPNYG